MNENAQDFLRLALDKQALKLGRFTLKSGRQSPYFFNAGALDSGAALWQTARCYAQALRQSALVCDMLFGPAYKGIPLATALACALQAEDGRDVPVAFNRKEAKDHGEGGTLIGAPLQGRVLIVDDVISAGTAIGESVALIRAAGAEPCGVLIGLDRQEKGPDGMHSAVQQVEREHGLPVISVARLDDLLALAEQEPQLQPFQADIAAYRRQWGA